MNKIEETIDALDELRSQAGYLDGDDYTSRRRTILRDLCKTVRDARDLEHYRYGTVHDTNSDGSDYIPGVDAETT